MSTKKTSPKQTFGTNGLDGGENGLSANHWLAIRRWMDKNNTFGEDGAPSCVFGHKNCSAGKKEFGPCLKELKAVSEGREYKGKKVPVAA